VDLVPYSGGKYVWDWDKIYPVAFAMRTSAITYGVNIRWGGVWDKWLNNLSRNLEQEVQDYVNRHAGSDFLDGPHFELV
jgi:hypothetical protein